MLLLLNANYFGFWCPIRITAYLLLLTLSLFYSSQQRMRHIKCIAPKTLKEVKAQSTTGALNLRHHHTVQGVRLLAILNHLTTQTAVSLSNTANDKHLNVVMQGRGRNRIRATQCHQRKADVFKESTLHVANSIK